MSNQPNDQSSFDINTLSFNSFGRDPQRDIVCLAPIQTIIRREEEIILVRKVRKVEEIDAGLSCPTSTVPLSSNNGSIAQPVVDRPSYPSPQYPGSDNLTPGDDLKQGYQEDLIVHSRGNCHYISPDSMRHLQDQVSASKLLQPGTYNITLKSGTFDYHSNSGHPGEPLVLLWLYGGRVKNHKTGVVVNSTWSSLNGYGDTLTIDVVEPTTLCSFFFDTHLEDNEGEVVVTVNAPDYSEDIVVHSQRNCYYIDPDSMKRIELKGASKMLQSGSYDIRIKSGAFGYRNESSSQEEPIVMLWIYGGKVKNHATNVEVGATWVSLNGYNDTLKLDVVEPTTLCAFFYDTYLEDNEGEVILSLQKA